MTIQEAFDRSVADYDDWIRRAVPGYPEIYELAVASVPYVQTRTLSIVDLGAGTGLFTWHLLRRYPEARCTLIDLAPEMLQMAKRRFAAQADAIEYLNRDYLTAELPQGCDLAISSLSIHHLEHARKKALFQRVHGALRPGGLFLNIDQIRAPSGELGEFYWSDWLARVRRAGGTEAQIEASVERRRSFDVDASLSEQLAWLDEAGFGEVDLLYKFGFVGLFWARKGT